MSYEISHMKWLSMKIIAIFKADAALNNFYSTRRSSLPESAQESGFSFKVNNIQLHLRYPFTLSIIYRKTKRPLYLPLRLKNASVY